MKIIKGIYKLFLLSGLIIFSSCEKEIELDLRSVEPQLVIEGTIPFNSLAKVRLTTSIDFFSDSNYIPVEGAIVTVADNTGNSDVLRLMPSGYYESDNIIGVEGRTYNLTVELDGKMYTSTSTMPYSIPIDSMSMFYVPAFGEAYPMIHFIDPKGIENYYRHIFYLNGKRMVGIDLSSDENRDGKLISRIMPYESESNNDEKIKKGDTISIETRFIDKGVYTFFRDLARMGSSLANPTSNINGGVLGHFSAYSYSKTTMIIVDDWKE